MSELRPLPVTARASLALVTLLVALGGAAAAQASPPGSAPSQAPARAGTAPAEAGKAPATNPVPRLRSRPAVSPADAEAVRLMVFTLERKTVFDAFNVVRPLLSVQGSVELDPMHNTISVRDNLAALSRVATAIRTFDRESQPVRIDVSLILAEAAKISPVRPNSGIAPDLLVRLRQLLRFDSYSLLAESQISSREGESVVYDMAQGYRVSFELGSVGDGKRIRLAGFRMVRALPGAPEHELVQSVLNLGLEQPLILGLTRDEAADRALMLVLRYQRPPVPVTPAVLAAGR